MKKFSVMLFGGAMWAPGLAMAAPVNIDFDSLASGSPGETVDNQYLNVVSAGVGVDFNGSVAVNSGTSRSGPNEVINFSTLNYPGGVIRIDAVGGEFSRLGGWWRDNNINLDFKAYSASDVLLGTVNFDAPFAPHGFFEVDTSDYGGNSWAYMVVEDGGFDIALDDFTAEIINPIPLPSGAAMAGLGLGLIGVRRRR